MKNPFIFSSADVRRKNKFSRDDMTSAIFSNTPPTYTFHPFRNLLKFSCRRDSVTIKIILFDTEYDSLQLLSKILYKIGDREIKDFHKVPLWMTSIITEDFYSLSKEWFSYFTREIRKYCEESTYSKIQWHSYRENPLLLFPSPTMEQKLWVYTNSLIDKSESREFIYSIKESVLPWLNPEMYKAIKKKQDNTRENSDYEQQRRQMFEEAAKAEKEELAKKAAEAFQKSDELDIIE